MASSPEPHLAPEPRLRTRRSLLPLISAPLALVFPVFFLLVVFTGGHALQGSQAVVPIALSVGAILGALVSGHLALALDTRPPAQTGRRLAITALVLGYLSLAVVLLLVIWLAWLIISGGAGIGE